MLAKDLPMVMISYGGAENRVKESEDSRAKEFWAKKTSVPCCPNIYNKVHSF
jgi:hypothetical protein